MFDIDLAGHVLGRLVGGRQRRIDIVAADVEVRSSISYELNGSGFY